MQLTDKQVQQFHEEGYLVFESLIHGEKLKAYQDLFDDLVERSLTLPVNIPHWTFEFGEDHKPIPGFLHKFRACVLLSRRYWISLKRRKSLTESKHSSVPTLTYSAPSFFPSCRMVAPR